MTYFETNNTEMIYMMTTLTKSTPLKIVARVQSNRWLGAILLAATSIPLSACANATDVAEAETVTAAAPLLYNGNGVQCGTKSYISLRQNNGYCSAENGGGGELNCNRSSVGEWERFRVVDMGNGKIALETSGGYYVSATNGGGSTLYANQTVPSTWETFKSTQMSNVRANIRTFKTYDNSHYIGVQDTGSHAMTAVGTGIGTWEPIRVDCLY